MQTFTAGVRDNELQEVLCVLYSRATIVIQLCFTLVDILLRVNNFHLIWCRDCVLIKNCLTVKIKGVISDLIGVLYLFCFHCTYDDRVDRRNNIFCFKACSSCR